MFNKVLTVITTVFAVAVGYFFISAYSSVQPIEVAVVEAEDEDGTLDTFTLADIANEILSTAEARDHKKGGKKGYGGHKGKKKHCKPKKKKKEKKRDRKGSKSCKCPFNLILKNGRCYDWSGNQTNWRPRGECRRQPVNRVTPIPVYQYQEGAGGG